MQNSFNSRSNLEVGGKTYEIFRLDAVRGSERLPYSLKILLENLLRNEDGLTVTGDDIQALADWDPAAEPSREIQYRPARVLMQALCGGPAVVARAGLRVAVKALGGVPGRFSPVRPAGLVVEHWGQVVCVGCGDAFAGKAVVEWLRNLERC